MCAVRTVHFTLHVTCRVTMFHVPLLPAPKYHTALFAACCFNPQFCYATQVAMCCMRFRAHYSANRLNPHKFWVCSYTYNRIYLTEYVIPFFYVYLPAIFRGCNSCYPSSVCFLSFYAITPQTAPRFQACLQQLHFERIINKL